MNIRTVLLLGAILLANQSISFAAANDKSATQIMLAAQDAPKVELYITSWCPYCQKAMSFFQSRGILFTVYDVEKDQDAARRKSQLDSRRGVPFAIVNGIQIHGFSEQAYQRALNGK